MSDSKKLAEDLLFELNKIEDFGKAEAQTIATLTITLALNELRKAIVNIGKAADATAGFTADIAAALVDPEEYDDEEDFRDYLPTGVVQNIYSGATGNPIDFGTIFPSLKVA